MPEDKRGARTPDTAHPRLPITAAATLIRHPIATHQPSNTPLQKPSFLRSSVPRTTMAPSILPSPATDEKDVEKINVITAGWTDELTFWVNGTKIHLEQADP